MIKIAQGQSSNIQVFFSNLLYYSWDIKSHINFIKSMNQNFIDIFSLQSLKYAMVFLSLFLGHSDITLDI